jgi:hypothetical protein
VVIDLENHAFDDVLGAFCVEQRRGEVVRAGLNQRCDGTRRGVLATGERVGLSSELDVGVGVSHSVRAQGWAINGGKMDGFSTIPGCRSTDHPKYGCLAQYDPLRGHCGSGGTASCIPNLSHLASSFAISDRTFEFRTTPSWAGHMVLGSATIEHFTGWNPEPVPGAPTGQGLGCDSGKMTQWLGPSQIVMVPSCIPDASGSMGPVWASYSGPHAQPVPTIFDRLDEGGVPWKIYSGNYAWSICPTFWSCLGSSQFNHQQPVGNLSTDLAAGKLPAVSFVIPEGQLSAHQPSAPMSAADTWVGGLVTDIMNSPEWSSTTIFITFDDCGCFYDHVNPLVHNSEWGVRVPMIIVGPYVRAGFTDHQPATFISMLTYIESTFGLAPLAPCSDVGAADPSCTDDVRGPSGTTTYGYADVFDLQQQPLQPVSLVRTGMSAHERRWLASHPFEQEGT